MGKIYKFKSCSIANKTINIEGTELLNKITDGFYNNGKAYNISFGAFKWNIDNPNLNEENDFPFIDSYIPVISAKAYNILKTYIQKSDIEVIPINIDGDEFYLLHVLHATSFLNESASKIDKYQSTGRIMNINHYVFLPDVQNEQPFFTVKQFPFDLFITEKVYQTIINNSLVGAIFEECPIKRDTFLHKIFNFK